MRFDSAVDPMEELKEVEAAAAAAGAAISAVSGAGSMSAGTGMQGGGGGRGVGVGLQGGPAGLQYSIPGILHFLQHEWSRFEMERGQWDVEKAEYQARIAFLQGERKGQENLKQDLVRRIKMLEHALKQERAKYTKLKYGSDSTAAQVAAGVLDASKPPTDEEGIELPPLDGDNYIAVSNVNWRQGRHLLRQYLQEIGYTDTIIDVRSNRVRSLLGLHDNVTGDGNEDNRAPSNAINGGGGAGAGSGGTDSRRPGAGAGDAVNRRLAEDIAMEAEAAVMSNFDFLNDGSGLEDDDELMAEDGLADDLKIANVTTTTASGGGQIDTDNVDSKAADESDWGSHFVSGSGQTQPARPKPVAPSGHETPQQISANLELGELGQLTITNDNESAYDITTPSQIRKTWNAKYTLRSHFDGIRALTFHPTEPVLITASEDQTLKMWNLQGTIPAKKSAALDVEPVYTFRAHTGPVLSLALSPEGDFCFSGGIDSTVRVWNMPSPHVDPYDNYCPKVLETTLTGHSDAIWSLSYLGSRQQLLSASADGTVKLWSPLAKSQPQLLKTFGYGNVDDNSASSAIPSSVDWVHVDPIHMVAGYANAECVIFDVETGKPVIKLDTLQDGSEVGAITRVVSHPTLPLTVTAHEDRHIRFFDNKSGKQTHAMMAHMEAVTSLAIDANGLYLISGSHDSGLRLWNLETKTCVQEITAHRKKFDESIFDVAFHPSKPFIASAGADALAKVFV